MRKARMDSKAVPKEEKAKAGTLDGTQEKAEKDGTIHTSRRAKEKECRATATTVANLATLQGSVPIHPKEKEREKESKERAGPVESKASERKTAQVHQKG